MLNNRQLKTNDNSEMEYKTLPGIVSMSWNGTYMKTSRYRPIQ